MGISTSCESTSVETAKLVLYDGSLQEFSCPVKISFLMQKYPSCFICNSDEMEFNDFLSAMKNDETVQVGQLYFALPLSWLKRRMQAAEMAALATKASSALSKGGCHKKMLFEVGEEVVKRGRNSGGGRSGSRDKFVFKLNVKHKSLISFG